MPFSSKYSKQEWSFTLNYLNTIYNPSINKPNLERFISQFLYILKNMLLHIRLPLYIRMNADFSTIYNIHI